MDMRITPRRLAGSVTPPVSKSMAHRAILAAMLSGGALFGFDRSEDMEATERCVAALKKPAASPEALPLLDCGESGSTLRFLIPVALALRGGGVFTGRGRLMERPQQPYFDLFDEKGIFYEQTGDALTVRGALTPGTYRLAGNVSSQFVTGLLYALPLLAGDSAIVLTTPLESRPYVDMTLDALARAGVTVENRDYSAFFVPGGQVFQPHALSLEADWSQAAFWYAAAFLDNAVVCQGLNPTSAQGDKVVSDLYWRLARPGDAEIDLSGCPDLLPPLAVMAAVRRGETRFVNAARLRMKESDRLSTTAAMLQALGVSARELPEGLIVRGGALAGGTVDGANDHRIVMAAAIAATAAHGPVTILGAQAVRKSYPSFWEEYNRLGGEACVL